MADYHGQRETERQREKERAPIPTIIKIVEEAEYRVALYQYVLLLGHPASSVSMITPFPRDPERSSSRCHSNPTAVPTMPFGNPPKITKDNKNDSTSLFPLVISPSQIE